MPPLVETLHPPDGYRLIAPALHLSLHPPSGPRNLAFIELLELRTVINMGTGPLPSRSSLGSWISMKGLRLVRSRPHVSNALDSQTAHQPFVSF